MTMLNTVTVTVAVAVTPTVTVTLHPHYRCCHIHIHTHIHTHIQFTFTFTFTFAFTLTLNVTRTDCVLQEQNSNSTDCPKDKPDEQRAWCMDEALAADQPAQQHWPESHEPSKSPTVASTINKLGKGWFRVRNPFTPSFCHTICSLSISPSQLMLFASQLTCRSRSCSSQLSLLLSNLPGAVTNLIIVQNQPQQIELPVALQPVEAEQRRGSSIIVDRLRKNGVRLDAGDLKAQLTATDALRTALSLFGSVDTEHNGCVTEAQLAKWLLRQCQQTSVHNLSWTDLQVSCSRLSSVPVPVTDKLFAGDRQSTDSRVGLRQHARPAWLGTAAVHRAFQSVAPRTSQNSGQCTRHAPVLSPSVPFARFPYLCVRCFLLFVPCCLC